ncbi:YbaK/EbsC family protein [Endozoicomonas sp.]|uniref:YbaK/EbsC family protein n=1 Tax=Endozoicomonas sp. TaxID=1892382 RepID=UPI003AF71731
MCSDKLQTVDVKSYLIEQGIHFELFEHKAVFTCDEAKAEHIGAKGIEVKNLFLKDQKSRRFYLVVAPANVAVNLKELGLMLGEKLKFANEENLTTILGLSPGSVSPFGLLNDHENAVTLLLHNSVGDSEFVQFHPNLNTQTLDLAQPEFRKCLPLFGNKFEFIEF